MYWVRWKWWEYKNKSNSRILKKAVKLSSLGMLIGLDFSWPVRPGSPWNPFCQATASSWCVWSKGICWNRCQLASSIRLMVGAGTPPQKMSSKWWILQEETAIDIMYLKPIEILEYPINHYTLGTLAHVFLIVLILFSNISAEGTFPRHSLQIDLHGVATEPVLHLQARLLFATCTMTTRCMCVCIFIHIDIYYMYNLYI